MAIATDVLASGAAPCFHIPSHRGLLPDVPDGAIRQTLDWIVVPAARPVEHLATALELAGSAGCQLVILCSRDVRAEHAKAQATEFDVARCRTINLPRGYWHPDLDFRTTRHRQVTSRSSDLSMKRNVGLLLARMTGAKRILFLDDDIREVTLTHVAQATNSLTPAHPETGAAVEGFAAVGMPAEDFPDNSVVCHAYRRAGRHQDVFISGSALAVAIDARMSFFPHIYNEDWLFLFDSIRSGKVAVGAPVKQEEYDPFSRPARAEEEEFGDLIAEGLMSRLHHNPTGDTAWTIDWEEVRHRRLALINELLEGAEERTRPSLEAALRRLSEISVEDCVSYIHQWRRDLEQWRRRLDGLPTRLSMDEALRRLGLRDSRTARRTPRRGPAGSGKAFTHPARSGAQQPASTSGTRQTTRPRSGIRRRTWPKRATALARSAGSLVLASALAASAVGWLMMLAG